MINIYINISKVISEIEAISKSKKNAMQGFMYRGIDDVYNTLNPLFGKHKIFTTSSIVSTETKEVTSKSGSKMQHKIVRIKYKVYTDDGSFVETEVEGEAMDSGDKVTNKCMAIAHKYALMQLFVIPTENIDDPDKDCHQIIKTKEEMQQDLDRQTLTEDFIDQINMAQDIKELILIGETIRAKVIDKMVKEALSKPYAVRKKELELKTEGK
jgi:hypothetical protein